jgi:hypothetical protein
VSIGYQPQRDREGVVWYIGHLDWRDGDSVLEVFVQVTPFFHNGHSLSFSFVAPGEGSFIDSLFTPADIDLLTNIGQENGNVVPTATVITVPTTTATSAPIVVGTVDTPLATDEYEGETPIAQATMPGEVITSEGHIATAPEPPTQPERGSFLDRIQQGETQALLLLVGAVLGILLFVGGGSWYLVQRKRDNGIDESVVVSVARLVDSHGRSFPIHLPQFTIGRAEDNQLAIDESFKGWQTISRHHAVITRDADGRYIIEDKGSENGIKVNGRPTQKNLLKHDWQVTIGGEPFTFKDYAN